MKCANSTLACLDILISYDLIQKNLDYVFSEINLVSKLVEPSGTTFVPPSNFDFSYLFKLEKFDPIKTRLRRMAQEASEEEENVPLPNIVSIYDSSTNEITSKFTIPEPYRKYKNFDLELSTNGV